MADALSYSIVADTTTNDDGVITGTNAVYATARATATQQNTINATGVVGQKVAGGTYTVQRMILAFDKSSLPADFVPTRVRLQLTATVIPAHPTVFRVAKADWVPAIAPNDTAFDLILNSVLEEGRFDDAQNWTAAAPVWVGVSGNLDVERFKRASGFVLYGVLSENDYNAVPPQGIDWIENATLAMTENAVAGYRPTLLVEGHLQPRQSLIGDCSVCADLPSKKESTIELCCGV